MAYLSLSGPNMGPSWLQVGSSWDHAGPKLAPTWLKLVPCWTQIQVPSRPSANPSPSKPYMGKLGRFWSLFGVYVGYCRAQMGVCEVQRPQGRGLEGLGLAQGRLGTRILVQHGPNLSQVGTNLGPAWTQLEASWSQLGSMLGPERLK